ncbi:MAG: oligosaccharide flippase family protein [Thermoguttaceae bacterium]|nr:oligosaccharide flippase family protein [Thermoguttaceae bacterium]
MVPASTPRRPLRSLLTGAFLQVITYLTGIALGLFLTPYLLHTLGERHYAIFLVAGLFTNWCGLIDFGMTTAVSRFVTYYYSAGDERGVGQIANTALVILSLLALVALCAGGIAALVARLGWSQTPDIHLFCAVFLMTGATFAVSKIADGASGVVNGTLHQTATGVLALALRVATGLTTFGILYFGGRITALLTGNLCLAILNLIVLAILVRIVYPPFHLSWRQVRPARAKELLGYSVWTFINQAGDLLIQRSDLILIGAFLSLADMTYYNLAVVVLISYYGSFLQAMTLWETNWFTHLARIGDTAGFERSRLLSYKLLTYISVLMSLMLIFWGGAFLRRWVGPECLAAYPAMVIIAAAMALYRGSAETNIRLLQAVARHRFLALMILLQGALSAALTALLLWLGCGFPGAAIGTAAPALLIHGAVVPRYTAEVCGERFGRWMARQLGYLLGALAAFVPPFFVLRWWLRDDYPTLLWTAALCCALYVSILLIIGLSRRERRDLFLLLGRFLKGTDRQRGGNGERGDTA